MKKMIIYGAGNELKKFIERQPLLVEQISQIVDGSVEKQGTEFCGTKIESPECLKSLGEDEEVFISSRKYMDEIVQDIKGLNSEIQVKALVDVTLDDSMSTTHCTLCGKSYVQWQTTGESNETQYNIIGNGKRLGACSYCGGIDRHRWVYWVLNRKTNIFEGECYFAFRARMAVGK